MKELDPGDVVPITPGRLEVTGEVGNVIAQCLRRGEDEGMVGVNTELNEEGCLA